MVERPINTEVCRSVWALLEMGGATSLDRLREMSGRPVPGMLPYLNLLLSNGYLILSGVREAVGGEALPLFTLIKRTGRDAPLPGEGGNLIDPNVLRKARVRRSRGTEEMPSLRARMRLAGERLGTFSRARIREFPGVDALSVHEFNVVWDELLKTHDFARSPDGPGIFQRLPRPGCDEVRRFFREHPGLEFSGPDVGKALGRRVPGPELRMAMDLLAAEGFTPSIVAIPKRRQAVYSVAIPAGREAADGASP